MFTANLKWEPLPLGHERILLVGDEPGLVEIIKDMSVLANTVRKAI